VSSDTISAPMTRDPAPTSPPTDDPKSRLLMAAIACIEEVGISAVTTRLIAAKAGTNIAAINYYYASKDQLIDRSLEYSRSEAFVNPLAEFDQFVAQGAAPREALRSVIRAMLRDSLRYPRVAFAHFRDAIENQDYDGIAVRQFNQFLVQLESRLSPTPSQELNQARRTRLAQIWLTISLNAMAPELLRPFTGQDLTVDRDLDRYVDQLLVGVFIDE
jgi:AcrR family transcriptional regulator